MISTGCLLVIIVGALLLLLPWATKACNKTSFLAALFTSVSATCVTGLVVVDTSIHWTVFGKLVILLLIQIGGLGFSGWNECKDYKFHFNKYSLHSKIVLSATGILLLAGGFLFFCLKKKI